MAHGVAGSTPVHGHGLRLLWYQARVAPFTVNTRLLYPHSSRAPPGFTCFSSFAEGVWAHGQHREVIEGGFLFGPFPRGLPPAWGLGTRAPRAVRGHPIQTDLTPNPNASPGDLELGCVFGRCVRDFDVGVKP